MTTDADVYNATIALFGSQLVVDLRGYDIHIDGALVMIDAELALIDPNGLPYTFVQELARRGIRTIELGTDDNGWIVNSLAVDNADSFCYFVRDVNQGVVDTAVDEDDDYGIGDLFG